MKTLLYCTVFLLYLFQSDNMYKITRGPFNITRLTSRRNDDVYGKLRWIVESDYFQTLLARRPPNDDPEVIKLIR